MEQQLENPLPLAEVIDEQFETRVRRLKESLSQDAVGPIVSEVLSRVTALKRDHRDQINLPSRHKVERLCYALIAEEKSAGAAFIQSVQEDGATPEAIYLNYLAEAATVLGEWWNEDHASFQEVTIGTSRIYAIVRSLSYLFVPDRPLEVKSAVFATVPGETHILGIRMAADLFGSEGWNIDLKTGMSHDEMVAEMSASPYSILGLSAGGDHALGDLARLLVALRICRPDLKIFLGGQITDAPQELVSLLDVDGSASTVEDAQDVLQQFWAELTH